MAFATHPPVSVPAMTHGTGLRRVTRARARKAAVGTALATTAAEQHAAAQIQKHYRQGHSRRQMKTLRQVQQEHLVSVGQMLAAAHEKEVAAVAAAAVANEAEADVH